MNRTVAAALIVVALILTGKLSSQAAQLVTQEFVNEIITARDKACPEDHVLCRHPFDQLIIDVLTNVEEKIDASFRAAVAGRPKLAKQLFDEALRAFKQYQETFSKLKREKSG